MFFFLIFICCIHSVLQNLAYVRKYVTDTKSYREIIDVPLVKLEVRITRISSNHMYTGQEDQVCGPLIFPGMMA